MKLLSLTIDLFRKFQINFDKYADPRVKDWVLMSSPIPMIIIISSYLFFCLKAGPWLMKNRKPYVLKYTLIVYNAIQIVISCYLTYEAAKLWFNLNWFCEPIDYTLGPVMQKGIIIIWCYFIAKITELLDTVFFVLRKKYNQITFLHLFHHSIMPLGCWFGLRYFAGGHGTLFGLINSFVHIIMYSYYLIAGLGPQYQKYLWWKRYVTDLQLIQFVIVFLHNLFPLFSSSCTYPKFLHVIILIFASIFICMFGNFYIQTYIKKKSSNHDTDSIKGSKTKIN